MRVKPDIYATMRQMTFLLSWGTISEHWKNMSSIFLGHLQCNCHNTLASLTYIINIVSVILLSRDKDQNNRPARMCSICQFPWCNLSRQHELRRRNQRQTRTCTPLHSISAHRPIYVNNLKSRVLNCYQTDRK